MASLTTCRLHGAAIQRASPLGPGRALTLPCGWNNADARYLRLLHLRVRTLPLADKVAYAKSSACSAEALQRYVEQTLPHKRRAGAGAKRVWLECLVHGNLDQARPPPTRVP